MKYNKILIVLLASLLAIAPLSSAQLSGSANGALSITNLVISPQPVVAGENITISFQLYNEYNNPLNHANIQLLASNPIINVSPTHSYITDVIGSGLVGSLGYNIFTYTMHIPSTLPTGEYTINVYATYDTNLPNCVSNCEAPASSTIPINIYVYGVPSVQVNLIPNTPPIPGSEFSATLQGIGSGLATALNVSIKIHDSTDFQVVGSNLFNLGSISTVPATSQVLLQVASNLTQGTHSLNMSVSYTTQQGAIYTENISLPISVIVNAPNMVASLSSAIPTELYSGSNQTLNFVITNIGTGTAKNVSIAFMSGPQIIVSGSASSFFVGSIPAGGTVTESIYVSATKSTGSNYTIPIAMQYSNANYQQTFDKVQHVQLNVLPAAVFNTTGVSSPVAPGDSYTPLTFKVQNIGNEEAQSISFTLQSIYPISPVTATAYVNDLKPGFEVNVTFYVSVDSKGNVGSYPITLYAQWRQPNGAANQQYSSSTSYYALVGNASSIFSSIVIGYVAIAVIAVIIVYVVYKRVYLKKSKKKGS